MQGEFINQLHQLFYFGVRAFLAIGLLILVVYYFRLVTVTNPKKKYDYISNNEITALKYSGLFIIVALILFLYDLLSVQFEVVETTSLLGGGFVMLMIGVVMYIAMKITLDIYYPKYMGKRLDKIRYKPRISPKTGNPMKLLNEEEEDTYLTEEMQADEDSLQYDYDVWIDDDSGYVQIEKYDGHLGAVVCPKCLYRTLRGVGDEMISSAAGEETLVRHYECSYCNHSESKEFKVSHVKNSEEASTA